MAAIRRAVARSLAARSLPSFSLRRSLASSAAAVDYDYWTEWEDEDRARGVLATDELGERIPRGLRWVFMGRPGAQKRVYATRVAELLRVPYISMGTLVRQELNPCSSLYRKIANAVNEGSMVPEEIIFGLLSKRLEEGYQRGETGFILDGIPRTRTQAEILDQIADIDLVVNFICSEDCLVKKRFGTDICAQCRKAIDANTSGSIALNACMETQSQHHQFISNAILHGKDSMIAKLRAYSEQSKLLEEYYRKQGKLLDFQASSGQGETWHGLLAALDLQHINANASMKLTV